MSNNKWLVHINKILIILIPEIDKKVMEVQPIYLEKFNNSIIVIIQIIQIDLKKDFLS